MPNFFLQVEGALQNAPLLSYTNKPSPFRSKESNWRLSQFTKNHQFVANWKISPLESYLQLNELKVCSAECKISATQSSARSLWKCVEQNQLCPGHGTQWANSGTVHANQGRLATVFYTGQSLVFISSQVVAPVPSQCFSARRKLPGRQKLYKKAEFLVYNVAAYEAEQRF